MAQNSKDAQKRASRAERRAAEAAEMKARAEQMEKERKQQTLIGAIVMAVLVILVAIGAFTVYHNMHKNTETQASTQTVEEAYDKLQQVENTPKLVDKKGGLLISKDGYGKSVEGAPTVAIYMDFLCPGCGNLHRQLDEDLRVRSILICISWRLWTSGPPTIIQAAQRMPRSIWPSMTAIRAI